MGPETCELQYSAIFFTACHPLCRLWLAISSEASSYKHRLLTYTSPFCLFAARTPSASGISLPPRPPPGPQLDAATDASCAELLSRFDLTGKSRHLVPTTLTASEKSMKKELSDGKQTHLFFLSSFPVPKISPSCSCCKEAGIIQHSDEKRPFSNCSFI